MEKLVRILAIDDEESFPFFVKHNLETITTHDFKIMTASSGKEGLKPARIYKPDLIPLDVIMLRFTVFMPVPWPVKFITR